MAGNSRGPTPVQRVRGGIVIGTLRVIAWGALLGVTGLLVHAEVEGRRFPGAWWRTPISSTGATATGGLGSISTRPPRRHPRGGGRRSWRSTAAAGGVGTNGRMGRWPRRWSSTDTSSSRPITGSLDPGHRAGRPTSRTSARQSAGSEGMRRTMAWIRTGSPSWERRQGGIWRPCSRRVRRVRAPGQGLVRRSGFHHPARRCLLAGPGGDRLLRSVRSARAGGREPERGRIARALPRWWARRCPGPLRGRISRAARHA